MYPNLYYVLKDWFGVEWSFFKIINCFGLFVAIAFLSAAWVLRSELKRKEKLELLFPREETIVVGKPIGIFEFITNGIIGFIFGFKILGLIFNRPADTNPQEYIFSSDGNFFGGIIFALILIGLKWYDRHKSKLKTPENRIVRIWPHDRVNDIIILGLIFGILGAKLFDSIEHLDSFFADPIGTLISPSGLTFYGGLILATIAIIWYGKIKGITTKHLVDSAAPALMIAYAIGRLGCQISGDGDWGVFNSAYVSDEYGNVSLATPETYRKNIEKNSTYFTIGEVTDADGQRHRVTDRVYGSIDEVPSRNIKAPAFLPTWLFAYSFPQNVNADGIAIPNNTEDHNRVLPQPVIPTSIWETIICTLIFLFLWGIRKRIKIPLVMFSIYLIFNGIERFFIETIRVNRVYEAGSYSLSQAEIIALSLVFVGLLLGAFALIARKRLAE